jgi:hypothetical protein
MSRAPLLLGSIALLVLALVGPARAADDFDHGYATWDQVLRRHVSSTGLVDYEGLASDAALDRFLDAIAAVPPEAVARWSRDQKVAFYINAYNALTFRTVLDARPIGSIRAIEPDPWEASKWTVGGRKMSLNEIEHKKLRRDLDEPRVHFVLVCAAISCPVLPDRAIVAEGLSGQLERATRSFFVDPSRNRVDRTAGKVYLSRILEWYGNDFVGAPDTPELADAAGLSPVEVAVVRYMAKYLDEDDRRFVQEQRFGVVYNEYDWSLNAQ